MVSNLFLNGFMLYLPEYKGTYSADNIPMFAVDTTFSIIVNLSNSDEIGSHFVAVEWDCSKNNVFYYNPFGGKCTNKYILSFMEKYSMQYKYSLLHVQSYSSDMCGFFCAGYLISSHLKIDFYEYHKIYNFNDLLTNDRVVTDFIIKHLNKLF